MFRAKLQKPTGASNSNVHDWLNNIWNMYIKCNNIIALKMKVNVSHAARWIYLENIMLKKKSIIDK